MTTGKLTRRKFVGLTAIAAGSMLAGCTGPAATSQVIEKEVTKEVPVEKVVTAVPAPKEKVEVLFWSELVGSKEEGRAALLNAFNAASDDIVVNHEGIQGADETNQKFLAALSGGIAPDLVGNDALFVPSYGEAGAVMDLGPFMEASASVKPASIVPAVLEACSYQGKAWGMPVYADIECVYYNADLLTEAGLDPANPPADWQGVREAAIAMTKRDAAGKLEVAGAVIDTYTACYLWIAMLYEWGGRFFDEGITKATFNSTEGKEALQFLVDLVYKDKVTEIGWGGEFEGTVNEPFIASKAGMNLAECCALTRRIVRWQPGLNWFLTPIPTGPEGRAQTLETVALMIPVVAKHKEEAWRVIEYWMQPKVMVRWARDVFRPPSTVAALEDQELMSDPKIAPLAEGLKSLVVIPPTTVWGQVTNTLLAETELAMLGTKDPGQALDDAAAAVNQVLEAGS